MSVVRGRVSVDVQFRDSTTSASVQSLKTIALQDATEHEDLPSGFPLKVVVLSGTVGTSEITVANFSSTSSYTYKNAAGVVPQFSGGYVNGVAFSYSGGRADLRCIVEGTEEAFKIQSRLNRVAVEQGRHFVPELKLRTFFSVDEAGQPLPTTGTYRIVVWGY